MEQQLLTEILPLILKIFPYSSSVSIQKMQPEGLFYYFIIGHFMVRSYGSWICSRIKQVEGWNEWIHFILEWPTLQTPFLRKCTVDTATISFFCSILNNKILLHFPDLHLTVMLLLLVKHARTEHCNGNWTGRPMYCVAEKKNAAKLQRDKM